MGLTKSEWHIGLLLACTHGGQHFYYRLLPPLIPVLLIVFDLPLWQLGLLVSVYGFSGGIFQAPMGVLSDRIDRRYLLPPGFALMGFGYIVFSTSSVIGATIPTYVIAGYSIHGPFLIMLTGMFISGMGFSVVHPVGYPMISANVTDDNKGKIFGLWGGVSKFGDAAAPLFVGVMILILAWHQILFVFGVLGILFSVILFIVMGREFVDTLPENHHSKPTKETTKESKINTADFRAFLLPIGLILLFFFSKSFTSYGLVTFTPVYIVDVYGYSMQFLGISFGPESVANLYFSVLLISGGLTQFIVGPISDRSDHRVVLVIMLTMASVGLIILTLAPLTPLTLLVLIIIVGCSLYGLNPARDALMSEMIPMAYQGRVFGYVWTMAMMVASIYPVLIGYIADTVGLRTSFTFLAAGTILAAIFIGSLFSGRIYHPTPQAETG